MICNPSENVFDVFLRDGETLYTLYVGGKIIVDLLCFDCAFEVCDDIANSIHLTLQFYCALKFVMSLLVQFI